MNSLESPEFKALEECLHEWNAFNEAPPLEDVNARRKIKSEMLTRRDAAYLSYREKFGDPTPDEFRVLEPHAAQVLFLSGEPWFGLSIIEFLSAYGVGLITPIPEKMILEFKSVVEYDNPVLPCMVEDFPHWKLRLDPAFEYNYGDAF